MTDRKRIAAGSAIAGLGCIGLHFIPFVGGNEPPAVLRYIAKVTTGVLSIIAGVAAVDPKAAKTTAVISVAAGAATIAAYTAQHLMLRPLREAYRRGHKC